MMLAHARARTRCSPARLIAVAALGIAGTAQAQRAAAPPLMFDGVTVVDVEQGKLVPAQRVVIIGNRIQTMGDEQTIQAPQGARVVDGRGKYLIPGLWDMHTHSGMSVDMFYPLFLANGVTGIRDAGSPAPLDMMRRWRQEILAGSRIGPPRQILSGPSLAWCQVPRTAGRPHAYETCVRDEDDARHVVDSLQAAGADMIKPRSVSGLYLAIADEARRRGIPFGGHVEGIQVAEAVDSGASIVDHWQTVPGCWGREPRATDPADDEGPFRNVLKANLDECEGAAEQFRSKGAWYVLTLFISEGASGPNAKAIAQHFDSAVGAFWSDSGPGANWLKDALRPGGPRGTLRDVVTDAPGFMDVLRRARMPLLAGTDASDYYWEKPTTQLPGFSLHVELAQFVAEGIPVVDALRSATLNPAKLLHATDSMGTVAPGKVADLVLLDADPLADITNTAMIRGVVANGRYFDRPTLDSIVADVRAKTSMAPPTLKRVRLGITVLSDDSLEGRRAGTRGARKAAAMIARQMAEIGLEPAGDSGYFQRVSPEVGVNVVGILRGTDPALSKQHLLVGAHYDHLGIGASRKGDSIYNGADDNASGTVAVLETARQLAAGPRPKRTIVFAAFTGGEHGALGSAFYLEHPVLPLKSMVAELEIEMIGRPDSLAGGPGKAWLTGYERTTVGDALAAAGIPIVADPRPEQNFFSQGGNIGFAKMGIVAHTLSSFSLHKDYHQPSDDSGRLDWTHVREVIIATARTVRLLADGDRPAWKRGGRP